MATYMEKQALRAAAKTILSRDPTENEADQLIGSFDLETGSTREKAKGSLRKFASDRGRPLTNDNLDRIVTDIENVLRPKP